jgi:fatty-acyl-CoA synthase/long-chain acyl-CoA synthetase
MLIRGGENLYPREIEETLATHPSVAEAAVFGIPDDRWGEEVAAVVRLVDGAAPVDGAALHAYVRERLAPQKAPRAWAFVRAMPMTASGKVQKFVLRDQLLAGEL